MNTRLLYLNRSHWLTWRELPVGVDMNGTPILVRGIGHVNLGPDIRRGAIQLDTQGEVVAGIIEIRYWNNALAVINRVKAKIEDLKPGLPEGVEVVPIYDRSHLIHRAQNTLRKKLIEESIIVALVCIIFLLHLRLAFVAIFTLPVGILIAMTVMYFQGMVANIMSLGGIAIAIGAMVDGAIVTIENVHKHLEKDRGEKPHWDITLEILETLRDQSIRRYSESVSVPQSLDNPKLREIGFHHYHEMCRLCHGAPGYEREEFAEGLYPNPPHLASGAIQKEWKDEQLYWIVDNGLKMTGMPSFGVTHTKEQMWGIIAFLRILPSLNPPGYAGMVQSASKKREHKEHHHGDGAASVHNH